MSTQRFPAEIEEEAVKQAIDRGYGVPDIAARLGVSAHSLHKWVKAVSPDKSEQQSKDLLEAKSEILSLRAQLRWVEEERDLLKSRAVLCQGTRVKSRFMNEHRHVLTVTPMCRALRVARAGFYTRLHGPVRVRLENRGGRVLR